MTVSPSIALFRRGELEAWIEQLIALLGEIDDDENIKPDLAGFERLCMGILARMPSIPASRLPELLPWNWSAAGSGRQMAA